MEAQSLHGPWLNLEEITHKTGLVKNEILYTIQTQHIKPVIYSNNRSFLAYSKNQQGQCIGHAHFRYSGTLAIHAQGIKEIVSDDQTILGFEPVQLLCPENIKACSTNNPFKHPLPNNLLQAWLPDSDIFNNGYYIMLLPYEYPGYENAESVIVEYTPGYYCENMFLTDNAQRFFIHSPNNDYVYGAYNTHVFRQCDFRFPKAALEQLLNSGIKQGQNIISMESRLSQKRTNDLHKVIAILCDKHTHAKTGLLWNILRKDIQRFNREYDQDHIIAAMNNQKIDWISSTGCQQSFKKSSFQTFVSRLRKAE